MSLSSRGLQTLRIPASYPVADLRGGAGDARPPLGVQILSISCGFWEILAKLYVGAPLGSWRPLLGEILDSPLLPKYPNQKNG